MEQEGSLSYSSFSKDGEEGLRKDRGVSFNKSRKAILFHLGKWYTIQFWSLHSYLRIMEIDDCFIALSHFFLCVFFATVNILYRCMSTSVFLISEDLKLICKLKWPYSSLVPSPAFVTCRWPCHRSMAVLSGDRLNMTNYVAVKALLMGQLASRHLVN